MNGTFFCPLRRHSIFIARVKWWLNQQNVINEEWKISLCDIITVGIAFLSLMSRIHNTVKRFCYAQGRVTSQQTLFQEIARKYCKSVCKWTDFGTQQSINATPWHRSFCLGILEPRQWIFHWTKLEMWLCSCRWSSRNRFQEVKRK